MRTGRCQGWLALKLTPTKTPLTDLLQVGLMYRLMAKFYAATFSIPINTKVVKTYKSQILGIQTVKKPKPNRKK